MCADSCDFTLFFLSSRFFGRSAIPKLNIRLITSMLQFFITILIILVHIGAYVIIHVEKFFSLPLLPKAKRSVGNKESGLEKIVVDMLRSKIKLR